MNFNENISAQGMQLLLTPSCIIHVFFYYYKPLFTSIFKAFVEYFVVF